MFKRPRLRATFSIVNASPALALLFLAAACSQPVDRPRDNTDQPPKASAPDGLTLPAVWQTADLGTPITSVAIAGELGSTIAVSYEDGGLQFLNFEGDRITEKAGLGVAQVADGRYVLLSDTPLTVFPGISRDGALSLYIHGGALAEPLAYPLDSGTETEISGLCSAAPRGDSDGVMRLAFWTSANPRELRYGRLVEAGSELIFLPEAPIISEVDISACLIGGEGATVFSAPATSMADLSTRGKTLTLSLDSGGGFALINDRNEVTPFTIKDGITVRMPEKAVDMAATADARGGGYSGGVIVVGGEAADGSHQVTFIDPSQLTLTPFGTGP